jgi:hypothetical protein
MILRTSQSWLASIAYEASWGSVEGADSNAAGVILAVVAGRERY